MTVHNMTYLPFGRGSPTAPELPFIPPASGEFKTVSLAYGAHPAGAGAMLDEIDPSDQSFNPNFPSAGPYGGGSYFWNSITAYGGMMLNTDLWIYHGANDAGHSAINPLGVYGWSLYNQRWKWYSNPLPTDGLHKPRTLGGYSVPFTEPQVETYYPTYNNHPGATDWLYDYDWGDYNGSYSGHGALARPGDRQPEGGHSRASNVFVPASIAGNSNGKTFKIAAPTGSNSGTNATGTHVFDWDDVDIAGGPLWRRTTNRPNIVGGFAVVDSANSRVLVVGPSGASGTMNSIRILNPVTETWASNCTVTGGPFLHIDSSTVQICPSLGVMVVLVTANDADQENSGSPTKQRLYTIPLSGITAGGTVAATLRVINNVSGTWPTGDTAMGANGWHAAPMWRENGNNNNFYCLNGKNGSTSCWRLEPPATLGNDWVITELAMTTGSYYHRNSSGTTTLSTRGYTKDQWVNLQGGFYLRHTDWIGSASVAAPVIAWRPPDMA